MTDDTDPTVEGGAARSGAGGGSGAPDIELLGEYLDRGMTPADPAIDESPESQRVLRSLRQVRSLAAPLLEADAAAVTALDQNWIRGIMENIGREAKAGRDIPFAAADESSKLMITEGTVRGLVRDAGDATPGILVGRVILDGDVTRVGAPIAVRVTVSTGLGRPMAETTEQFRRNVHAALRRHTDLVLTSIDVVVDDLHEDLGGAGAGKAGAGKTTDAPGAVPLDAADAPDTASPGEPTPGAARRDAPAPDATSPDAPDDGGSR
ncbi:Asp23/Gls24 family envelope stress response protein [Plantibacter sp. YIM 135347]|uniref:Asp23/Gls24 family envelope stress response protein n=1 Tax=Plantibacter sp. YIM 135347 TaxID=3423919 RepID=UPI003D354016